MKKVQFHHIRHATSIIEYAGRKILVDPVFCNKATMPAIPLTPLKRLNPLVDISTPPEELLNIDMVLSTHTHRDHFDPKAAEMINKSKPVICQSEDAATIAGYGFNNVYPVITTLDFNGISITRVHAQHGTGETEIAMAPASGFILSHPGEPTMYLTGDTVFNESVRKNIEQYSPEVLIINAGSPKFLNSSHIVMNIVDVENTLRTKPQATFIIVHLDTFNHCIETREDMHEYFTQERLAEIGTNKFFVPADNEIIDFNKLSIN